MARTIRGLSKFTVINGMNPGNRTRLLPDDRLAGVGSADIAGHTIRRKLGLSISELELFLKSCVNQGLSMSKARLSILRSSSVSIIPTLRSSILRPS